MKTNRYGLSSDIPLPIKRIVRQNCCYGCIFCGLFLVEYEHVDPEFSDAKDHYPDSISLLCPNHHSEVTRGLISKEEVKERMRNPISRSQGFSNKFFYFKDFPDIEFAGSLVTSCQIPIMYKDVPLISITEPEVDGAPYILNAKFFDSKGLLSLEIVNNEWLVNSSVWDFELKGQTMVIREKGKKIVLKLKYLPCSGIIIEKLDMNLGDARIVCDKEKLELFKNEKLVGVFMECCFSGSRVGIKIG